MSDTPTTPTSPFSIGGTLKPGAGEQQISRKEAAAIIAAKLREAGQIADANDTAAKDEGGFGGFVQGAVQGVNATLGQIPNVTTGVAKAIVNKVAGGGEDKYDKLAAKLVDLLPAEALYPSLISSIDRRQIYAQVMSGDKPKTSRTVGGVTFDPDERFLAGRLFGVENEQAKTAAQGLAAAGQITGDAAVKAYVDESAGAFRAQGTTLGISPTAPAALEAVGGAAATATATGGSDQSFADILAAGVGGANGKTPFLTDADVQALFRLSSTDLGATNAYIDQLASYRAKIDPTFADPYKVSAGTGIAGVTSTMPIPPRGTPGDNTGPYASTPRNYSITEAKDLLYGMSKDEVAKMQNLLLRAGYFADAQGNSTKPLFAGDPTDQTTQRGWLNLIGDAIRSGQPIFDTLSKKALDAGDKFSTVDGKIARDTVLTDSAAISQDADTLGTKEIGRKLTEEEHAKVVEFIHGLEKTAQGVSNEPGAQTVENPDVQAEITKYLADQFPTETASKDVAGTYDLFTQMLAGPGGGR